MKKFIFPMLAVVVAIGFSAFTAPAKHVTKKGFSDFSFIYQLTSQSQADLSNPSNYKFTGEVPTCGGNTDECNVVIVTNSTPATNSTLSSQPSGSVTFNAVTGIPDGGTEFVENQQLP